MKRPILIPAVILVIVVIAVGAYFLLRKSCRDYTVDECPARCSVHDLNSGDPMGEARMGCVSSDYIPDNPSF